VNNIRSLTLHINQYSSRFVIVEAWVYIKYGFSSDISKIYAKKVPTWKLPNYGRYFEQSSRHGWFTKLALYNDRTATTKAILNRIRVDVAHLDIRRFEVEVRGFRGANMVIVKRQRFPYRCEGRTKVYSTRSYGRNRKQLSSEIELNQQTQNWLIGTKIPTNLKTWNCIQKLVTLQHHTCSKINAHPKFLS